jgi:hypothetical protein
MRMERGRQRRKKIWENPCLTLGGPEFKSQYCQNKRGKKSQYGFASEAAAVNTWVSAALGFQ